MFTVEVNSLAEDKKYPLLHQVAHPIYQKSGFLDEERPRITSSMEGLPNNGSTELEVCGLPHPAFVCSESRV